MLLLMLLSLPTSARADEPSDDAEGTPETTDESPNEPWSSIPEPMRDDLPGLGYAFGAGSIAFSFAGVPAHVLQSVATGAAAPTSSLATTLVPLQRSANTHILSAALAAGRVVPATMSMIGLGVADDDASMLHALGTPYIILGIYDLVGAAISGTSAIRLFEDRRDAPQSWSGAALTASDSSIEVGGAWAGGMVAVGTIELIVGGLALHGALAIEADRRFVVLPTLGGATIAGRF